MKKLSLEEAHQVLSSWTALEVLSPQSYRKPEDLAAGGDRQLIASFKNDRLPWENGGEFVPEDKKLFYQVVIGTVNYEKAISALSSKYLDNYIEKQQVTENAILASIVVDQKGYLLQDVPSVAISSFAWGLPLALKGELKELGAWVSVEKDLVGTITKILNREDEDEMDLCLDIQIIKRVYFLLIKILNLPEELVNPTFFAVKNFEYIKSQKIVSPSLLNSFYLKDLSNAKLLVAKDEASNLLKRYLGMIIPSFRKDILNSPASLEEIASPKFIPPARWPSMGRHPLVLLQQASVNLALKKMEPGELLAVNGPPGTGKTTLLRDVVAGLITDRAEVMCLYDDPAKAFVSKGEKVKAGQGWLEFFSLDNKLKGFEILVASSNNKAVENISVELPQLKAIAADADELRYFKILSDHICKFETWGMVAAALGNSANRNRFVKSFWWDEDFGFATYLAQASGLPQLVKIIDLKSKKVVGTRPPQIVQENNPPKNHEEALKRWRDVRKEFLLILTECNSKLETLESIRSAFQHLDSFEPEELDLEKIEKLLNEHERTIPWILSRWLKTAKSRDWRKKKEFLTDRKNKIVNVSQYREKLGTHVLEKRSFEEEGLHHISPWCDREMQLLRDQLFIAAIKLHKAFIDAAAIPLRHNLGILLQNFSNLSSIDHKSIQKLPCLWSSFFLVVPCVSTTFASIDRMLTKMPQNSLGWLLVDEAGQATPQSAVGAIMRVKRAIVVGDPMQIEPIVQLPKDLTKSICKQFEVEPERYNAPEASVQTLADHATSYFAKFESKFGSRIVGVPLLVHRRCSEPMFSIANTIAYDHLMKQAKSLGTSSIRECLGSSSWFDVIGRAEDKWCSEEGEKLLSLLFKLESKIPPDLFIVAPFVSVVDRLRKLIYESGILQTWGVDDYGKWISERIGTIHTMQGREAEAVIFVLGAQSKEQLGARIWAGSKPNLLNVAVTRAKEAIYVIGNKTQWSEAGVFKELSDFC